MKFFLLIFFLFTFFINSFSQELVQNGQFEFKKRESNFFLFNSLENWYKPTWSSTDFQTNLHHWKSYHFSAYSGDTYMGIVICSNYDYSEYGTNKLFKKLEKDSLYCLSMFVCLGNASTVSIKGVDALFSSKRIKVFTLKNLSYKYKPDLKLGDSYITNKKKWIKISGIYKAKGDEKYLTIGNFTKTDSVIFPKLLSQSKIYEGYLLIDDVSLIPIHDSSQCDCNIKRISIETIESDSISEGDRKRVISAEGTILSLNNLYFDTDSYEIKPESFEELNKLYNLLVSRPELKITVNGYTDNTGSYKHNLRLSQQRAKAVVDYLISKGIEKERLKYIGYGEDNPIRTNETEEGRAANRRIEVEFIR